MAEETAFSWRDWRKVAFEQRVAWVLGDLFGLRTVWSGIFVGAFIGFVICGGSAFARSGFVSDDSLDLLSIRLLVVSSWLAPFAWIGMFGAMGLPGTGSRVALYSHGQGPLTVLLGAVIATGSLAVWYEGIYGSWTLAFPQGSLPFPLAAAIAYLFVVYCGLVIWLRDARMRRRLSNER